MKTKRTAVISGAASGMGRATAERFLAEGWNVIALDLNPSPLHDLREAHDLSLFLHTVDVAKADQVNEAISSSVINTEGIQAVITAAGIYPPSTLETSTLQMYRQIFDVNVLGTLNVLQATEKYLRTSKLGANVVTFASVDAFAVSRGQLLYSASKAAVVSLTRSLAIELAPDGVIVNGVAPGWVETAGTKTNDRMAEAISHVPLGRAAEPAEIADWVWTLGNGSNKYMTGETLFISGGAAIR